jgi:hypothetical protein
MLEIQIRYDQRHYYNDGIVKKRRGHSGVITVGKALNKSEGRTAISNLCQFLDQSVVIVCLYNTAASRQEFAIRRKTHGGWAEVKPNTDESSKVPLGVDNDPFFD